MNVMYKRLPTPAMLVACVALVVALGGVSYAAGVLPRNSVGSAQLQKKAVTGAKLKRNTVTTTKVKNGSLLAVDFKTGQLAAAAQGPKGDVGPQGTKGDRGLPGEPGLKGAKGEPGATNVTVRTGASGPLVGPGGNSKAVASCLAGETLVGGGTAEPTVGGSAKSTLWYSGPDANVPLMWAVVYRNDGSAGSLVGAKARALCVSP
jgi:hypothetical protein